MDDKPTENLVPFLTPHRRLSFPSKSLRETFEQFSGLWAPEQPTREKITGSQGSPQGFLGLLIAQVYTF